jgi:tRNA pseudouridine65 synthase
MQHEAEAPHDAGPALEILYLDDRLCAVAKPSGIMVHATNISTDRLFITQLLQRRLGRAVKAAHRLDRATSGALLFALDREAAADLGRQFSAGSVEKRYLAVVRGWVDDEGRIDRPLQRPRGLAQPAVTHYRCLGRIELPVPVPPHDSARYSFVEARPETGRRHQIRRHFNGIAHPIVGDVNHGDRRHNRLFRARFGCHRLLLHAERLAFRHPEDGRLVTIHAPPPADFRGVLNTLGWSDADTTS